MRRAAILAGTIAIGYWLFSIVAGVLMAEAALRPRPRPPVSSGQMRLSLQSAGAEVRDIVAEGLRAWHILPSAAAPDVVLVLHGIGDTRIGAAGYARLFVQHGYQVLLPDLRAHGESRGDVITYGIREAEDVSRWVTWTVQKPGPSRISTRAASTR
jgi:pimeloyl-ACP methyl ester carboxylesterase